MLHEEEVSLTSFSFKVFEFFIIIDKSLIDPGDMGHSSVVGVLESISDGLDGVALFGLFAQEPLLFSADIHKSCSLDFPISIQLL